MKIDRGNIVSIFGSLDNDQMVYIVVNTDVPSICACYLITEMLKRRMLRYEVTFKEQIQKINLVIRQEEIEYVLSNEGNSHCTCIRREMTGVCIVYEATKLTGAASTMTVWPMAVTYAFLTNLGGQNFNNIVNKNSNNKSVNKNSNNFDNHNIGPFNNITLNKSIENCTYCSNLNDDILLQIKRLNCTGNGIFHFKSLSIPFASTTSLFSAIKSYIPFILQKRLFVRPYATDNVIYNCLAQLGISISQASEKYSELSESFRIAVNKRFGTETSFVLRNGHDIELTAFEHALLISYFICTRNSLYALLSLTDRRLMQPDTACIFYQTIITLFLIAIRSQKRAGNTLVFQLLRHKIDHSCVVDILTRLLEQYIVYRFGTPRKYVIIYSSEGQFFVHSCVINLMAIVQKLKTKDRSKTNTYKESDLVRENTLKLHDNEMVSKFIKIISEQ